jgi:hypothetical protein
MSQHDRKILYGAVQIGIRLSLNAEAFLPPGPRREMMLGEILHLTTTPRATKKERKEKKKRSAETPAHGRPAICYTFKPIAYCPPVSNHTASCQHTGETAIRDSHCGPQHASQHPSFRTRSRGTEDQIDVSVDPTVPVPSSGSRPPVPSAAGRRPARSRTVSAGSSRPSRPRSFP